MKKVSFPPHLYDLVRTQTKLRLASNSEAFIEYESIEAVIEKMIAIQEEAESLYQLIEKRSSALEAVGINTSNLDVVACEYFRDLVAKSGEGAIEAVKNSEHSHDGVCLEFILKRYKLDLDARFVPYLSAKHYNALFATILLHCEYDALINCYSDEAMFLQGLLDLM